MIAVEWNVSLSSIETIFLEEILVWLQITFAFQEIFDNTQVFENILMVHSLTELQDLFWVEQEEVCNALPAKNFHTLEEIIFLNFDVDTENVIIMSHFHVEEASQLVVKNI